MTSWKPIIVGVDTSPDSAWAACMAWKIATAAKTDCHLVHGTREPTNIPLIPGTDLDLGELNDQLTAAVRQKLIDVFRGNVPPRALEQVEVRLGTPAWALSHAIAEYDAGFLVLGGKHHAAPASWVSGSTAHHAVRTIDIPMLITWEPRRAIRRVLAAVDLSHAATPTLRWADRFAKLFDAELQLLHVVEPITWVHELGLPFNDHEHHTQSAAEFREIVTTSLGNTNADRVVIHGPAERVIQEQSRTRDADVVVVGSHGKGWADRVLIGSTTERLINHLPRSLLVVPVHGPARKLDGRTRKADRAVGAAG